MNTALLIQILGLPIGFALGALVVYLLRPRENHGSLQGSSQTSAVAPNTLPPGNPVNLPPEARAQLAEEAKKSYLATLGHSAEQFSHDLSTTSETINNQIKDLSTRIIVTELEEYRTGLAKLRQEAMTALTGVQAAVEQERQIQEERLAKEIQAERERLLEQMDTKLGDAVSSFLVETLQHNVDLGSQTAYLMAMLEEHKDELKQEVADEA